MIRAAAIKSVWLLAAGSWLRPADDGAVFR
jgi:hypothetical protein